MKKITFLEMGIKVLAATEIAMTIDEIWNYADNLNWTKDLNTQGRTPKKSLESRFYLEIKSNKNSLITLASKQPRKYILKQYQNELQLQNSDDNNDFNKSQLKFLEKDLHPLLVKYANGPSFNLHCKTIRHNKSKNRSKGVNEWLHPDIVGVYFPFDDFNQETLLFQKKYLGVSKIRIYSFELKRELNFANLRASYFQAISNSSWSNEGYLVTLKIDETTEFNNELKRLNEAFKIGVIVLDANNIEQSRILFPAKENNHIDWVTFNRIVEDNSDFEEFVKDISSSIKINKIFGKYDQVLNDEDYAQHVTISKII